MLFTSPIRKEVMRVINNRINNAEIAFKAEMKTIEAQRRASILVFLDEVIARLKTMRAEYKARKEELLRIRVGDILKNIL